MVLWAAYSSSTSFFLLSDSDFLYSFGKVGYNFPSFFFKKGIEKFYKTDNVPIKSVPASQIASYNTLISNSVLNYVHLILLLTSLFVGVKKVGYTH